MTFDYDDFNSEDNEINIDNIYNEFIDFDYDIHVGDCDNSDE